MTTRMAELKDRIAALMSENERLTAEIERLRTVLREVYHEWDTADGEVSPDIMELVKAALEGRPT